MNLGQNKTFGKGRFQVTRMIGKGGMGVVYEAFDSERNMNIALKTLLHMDPDNIYLFKKEFRALHDLVHPNLCSFMELIEDDGLWLLTMELVHGIDFFSHVHQLTETSVHPGAEGGIPSPALPGDATAHFFDEDKLRRSLAGLSEGLNALHQVGKVHRDVKPTNVLVTPQQRVVLLDFGLTVDSGSCGYTELQVIAGTAEYMAPEQANSQEVGAAADWYSVGVMLYEALTGELPFVGKPLDVLRKKLADEPVRPREIVEGLPLDLEMLCVELLKTNPEERPTALEILDLVQVDQPQPVLASITDVSRHTRGTVFVGRGAELGTLFESYQLSTRGGFESVVVEGVSGIGKSALVNEFTSLVDDQDPSVVVLKGRCYERETAPYKGFDGIIDSLIRHIRIIPGEEALELEPNNAELLLRLFPVLERSDLFAKMSSAPVQIEDPHELKNRAFDSLRDMLLKLSRQRPVVLIIDDMQWVDEESKQLLSYLVDENHPLPLSLQMILSARYATETKDSVMDWGKVLPRHTRVQLSVLDEKDAIECARQSIFRGSVPIDVDPSVIAVEASGHPLYIAELVQHIARGAGEWRRLRLDDVILSRANSLPPTTRHLLEMICVLGTPFSRENLQNLTYLGSEEFFEGLSLLRACNLIRSSGPGKKHLVEAYHNRVREAVTDYLQETDDAKMMHLEIGRFFLNTYSESEIEENIFEIVRHLDSGLDLISDEAEMRYLAGLYFSAGQKSTRLAAYRSAQAFFEKSLELVDEKDWTRDYDFMFQLYSTFANCAYINGDLSQAKELVGRARSRASSVIDQAKICQTFVLSLAAEGRPLDAIDQAFLMVRNLGIWEPLRPSKIFVLLRLILTKLRFFGKSEKYLVNLPLAKNKRIIAALELLYSVADLIYYHVPNLWATGIFRSVQLSVKYGIYPGGATSFVSWGIILAGMLKKYRVGYKYGKIGLTLARKFEDSGGKAQAIFIWANFVQHWRDPIRETLPLLLESHEMAHRTGNIPYLAYSGTNYCYHSFLAGRPLDELADDFKYYGEVIEDAKQEISYRTNRVFYQVTLNLMGETKDPALLKGSAYNPEEGQLGGKERELRPNLFVHHFCALILKVYFHRASDAFGEANLLGQYADAAIGTFRHGIMPFYDSLACAVYSRDVDKKTKRTLLKRIRRNQKSYRKLVQSAPINHRHKYKLVEAELARIRGQAESARLLYDEAISGAIDNQFVHDAALACELAARCYQESHDRESARAYALKAREHYETWGATAKLKDVIEQFSL